MPQESTPCLPPCQCRKSGHSSSGKGTRADGEDAIFYPAERCRGWWEQALKTAGTRQMFRFLPRFPAPVLFPSSSLPLADDSAGKRDTRTAQSPQTLHPLKA